jgi:DNA primase
MPFIKRDFIESLNDKVDIISTIGKRITLTKKGKDYKACCPFHEEKTPSFSVSAEKGAYHCFGCGASGYAINFVQEFDNLDFVEAVERLAEENNITVEYEESSTPTDRTTPKFKELNKKVCEFFEKQLRTHSGKNTVIQYAKDRGISGEIAKIFALGFAPNGWNNLYNHFSHNAEDIANLEILGLIIKKDNGEYYDRFRNRLMFPIFNSKNQVIGFGGRVLSTEDKPKYLNSSQSPVFDKSRELYGLSHARKYTKKIDYLLVVEGYMDVIGLHSSGVTSCVATLGTATTPHHIKILARNTHTIIFCFDGDTAGYNAGIKALHTVLPLINADMSIKFLFLPEGEDPDSLIKKEGKLQFEKRIHNATHLSKFLFSHLKKDVDFSIAEGKTKVIQDAGKLIHLVKYGIYKEQLIHSLAEEVGQDTRFVKQIIDNNAIQQEQAHSKIPDNTTQNIADIKNNFKSQLAKIITMVLKHPALGTDELMTEIKKIPHTEILQKIIDLTAFDEGQKTHMLIKTFEHQPKVYNRLWSLVKNSPKLTEVESQIELETALKSIKRLNKTLKNKQEIINANDYSSEKQQEIADKIKQDKIK